MISMKIGKTIATVVGGSILLIQIGCHLGYVEVNWGKVKKDVTEVSNNADVNKKLSIYSRTFAKVRSTHFQYIKILFESYNMFRLRQL